MRRRRGGEATAELAALADGSLPPEKHAALEARVAASAELAERLAEQQQALALMRTSVEDVDAPAGLRARIEAQRHARRVWGPPRLVSTGLAVAAALAVAIGLTAALRSGPPGGGLRAALGPTDLAPGATGEATLTKTSAGWRIELEAAGLPRLDKGRFYEAWLRNEAGVLVPIGTFNEGPKVTLWAGVSPKSFTTLTVTREQADGNQASSGMKVLVGKVNSGGSG
jgi:anti-sigma-K factor RskA